MTELLVKAIAVVEHERDQLELARQYHKRNNPDRGNVEAMMAAIQVKTLDRIIKQLVYLQPEWKPKGE